MKASRKVPRTNQVFLYNKGISIQKLSLGKGDNFIFILIELSLM